MRDHGTTVLLALERLDNSTPLHLHLLPTLYCSPVRECRYRSTILRDRRQNRIEPQLRARGLPVEPGNSERLVCLADTTGTVATG